jgi:hypothetical protein
MHACILIDTNKKNCNEWVYINCVFRPVRQNISNATVVELPFQIVGVLGLKLVG